MLHENNTPPPNFARNENVILFVTQKGLVPPNNYQHVRDAECQPIDVVCMIHRCWYVFFVLLSFFEG